MEPPREFSDEQWHEMVATAAYYRAQARGFGENSPDDDWYGAETELRARLARAEEGSEPSPESGASLTDDKMNEDPSLARDTVPMARSRD